MRLQLLEGLSMQGGFSAWQQSFKGFRLFVFSDDGEPKYDGYQIWIHADIPDYTDPNKNVINMKYPIKNYPI